MDVISHIELTTTPTPDTWRKQSSFTSPEANLRHASAFSNTWAALSAVQRRLGRVAEARAIDDTRATLWRAWEQKSPDNPFVRRQLESLASP
jgi:hypothetical protein